MNGSIFMRRFGHGAARLPMANVPGRGLSQHASSRAAYEEIVAFMPGIFAVLLAISLGLGTLAERSKPYDPELVEAQPTRITPWEPALPAAPSEAISKRTAPANPTPIPAEEPLPQIAHTETGALSSPPRAFQMPRMQALSVQPGHLINETKTAKEEETRGTARPHFASSTRPSAARNWTAAPPQPALETTGQNAQALASIPAAIRARRAPPVAAARPAALRPSTSTAPASAPNSQGIPGAGWEEVALNRLPDCSPPGRQDQLKQQILREVPATPECADANGRFRFVETRNLGAFLMWSSPSAQQPFAARRARDACEVLEAALRCLAGGDSALGVSAPSPAPAPTQSLSFNQEFYTR